MIPAGAKIALFLLSSPVYLLVLLVCVACLIAGRRAAGEALQRAATAAAGAGRGLPAETAGNRRVMSRELPVRKRGGADHHRSTGNSRTSPRDLQWRR
jgi:hypothetical protein